MKKFIPSILLLFPTVFAYSQNVTEVVICCTIHSAHKVNKCYTYDSLYAYIDAYNPDVIGVEVRPEDMDSSVTYLRKCYPFEMYSTKSRYPDKRVVGFDWLGDEIRNKPIPPMFWKTFWLKVLERKLDADSTMKRALAVLDVVNSAKVKLAMESDIYQLNDGRYDLLNTVFYEQLQLLFHSTPYAELSEFYRKRDEHIARNIFRIIRQNRGKRIVFLMGADHGVFAFRAIKKEFADSVELLRPTKR